MVFGDNEENKIHHCHFHILSFNLLPEAPEGKPGLPVHLCMTPTSQEVRGPAQAHSIASAKEHRHI